MMRKLIAVAVAGCWAVMPLSAQDAAQTRGDAGAAMPPVRPCIVEAWRFELISRGVTLIEGSTDCDQGVIDLEIYQQDMLRLTERTMVQQHRFRTIVIATLLDEAELRYQMIAR